MLELVPFAAARNPIDVTGQVLNAPTLLDRAIELATGHGDYGSVVSFQGSIGRNPALMEATRGARIERKAANPEMHFAVAGFCTAGLHAGSGDGRNRGVRGGDPRDARDRGPRGLRSFLSGTAPAAGRPGARRPAGGAGHRNRRP